MSGRIGCYPHYTRDLYECKAAWNFILRVCSVEKTTIRPLSLHSATLSGCFGSKCRSRGAS